MLYILPAISGLGTVFALIVTVFGLFRIAHPSAPLAYAYITLIGLFCTALLLTTYDIRRTRVREHPGFIRIYSGFWWGALMLSGFAIFMAGMNMFNSEITSPDIFIKTAKVVAAVFFGFFLWVSPIAFPYLFARALLELKRREDLESSDAEKE